MLTLFLALLLGIAIGAILFSSSPSRGLQELVALLVILASIGVVLLVVYYLLKFLLYSALYVYSTLVL